MTETLDVGAMKVEDIPGGPYDVEFFFDPGCPFTWHVSMLIRRVAELRDVTVGWRFISLLFLNEDTGAAPMKLALHAEGLRYLRICAAARERFGNDAVGSLYRAYGERYWYVPVYGGHLERHLAAAQQIDLAAIVAGLGLPADVLGAADLERWDQTIRDETALALERTGPDVGSPVLTYGPPDGNSLFGPIMSSVPDDDAGTLALYDALRTLADFPAFSELKRTKRAPVNLPLPSG